LDNGGQDYGQPRVPVPLGLQPRREIDHRIGERVGLDHLEHDDESAEPAVVIAEGVKCLELVVAYRSGRSEPGAGSRSVPLRLASA